MIRSGVKNTRWMERSTYTQCADCVEICARANTYKVEAGCYSCQYDLVKWKRSIILRRFDDESRVPTVSSKELHSRERAAHRVSSSLVAAVDALGKLDGRKRARKQ